MRALNDGEQLMAPLPDAAATVRLRRFTLVLLALNVLAAIIAIAAKPARPARRRRHGRRQRVPHPRHGHLRPAPAARCADVAGRAPGATPGSVELGRGRVAYVTAVVVGIGGIGAMAAEPTADTSRSAHHLGIAWLVVAAVLIALATSAVLRSRRSATAPARPALATTTRADIRTCRTALTPTLGLLGSDSLFA